MVKRRVDDNTIKCIVKDYNDGIFTAQEIAIKYKFSQRKIYYVLKEAGVKFTHKRRKEVTQSFREKISKAHKGKIVSEETKKKLSQSKQKGFDGLNKYGYTKKHSSGYIQAYAPLHPRATKDGKVFLHTIIMEQYLGRYLEDDEIVHHINHIRDDNRIENLQLMKKSDHMSMHMKERHENNRKNKEKNNATCGN